MKFFVACIVFTFVAIASSFAQSHPRDETSKNSKFIIRKNPSDSNIRPNNLDLAWIIFSDKSGFLDCVVISRDKQIYFTNQKVIKLLKKNDKQGEKWIKDLQDDFRKWSKAVSEKAEQDAAANPQPSRVTFSRPSILSIHTFTRVQRPFGVAELGVRPKNKVAFSQLTTRLSLMTTQQIRTLSTEEKLQIMEAIWDDMRNHYENAPIPSEVVDLLRHRQNRVATGEVQLLNWDEVKSAIGRG